MSGFHSPILPQTRPETKSLTQTEDSQFWFSPFVRCNYFNLVAATPDAMVDTPLRSPVACHDTKAANSQCQTNIQSFSCTTSTNECLTRKCWWRKQAHSINVRTCLPTRERFEHKTHDGTHQFPQQSHANSRCAYLDSNEIGDLNLQSNLTSSQKLTILLNRAGWCPGG